MLRRKKAQSVLEYVIIFVAVVVAVYVMAKRFSVPAVDNALNKAADVMVDEMDRYDASKPPGER
jgi:hypothetical protein